MNKDLLEKAIYQSININLRFENEKPKFGDLFMIRDFEHSEFPPSGKFNFEALAEFEFDQVDDYFGITSYEDEGDDVKIWLFPMIKGESVYHNEGPFDSIQLSYNVLRNPPQDKELFLKVVSAFARHLPVQPFYELRGIELGNPPDLSMVESDINEVVEHWRKEGIEPGSSKAMRVRR